MQLEHKFSVPVPIEQAWDVLLDVERIAPCMPGATVESFDGETIVGRVKVKVGPIQVTYAGTAKFTDKDVAARRAVILAAAKESRGTGTANATITARMVAAGDDATDVTVTTDLAITGKPAQFGRGVMAEVGNKILGRFADCLADTLAQEDGSAADAEGASTAGDAAVAPAADDAPAEAGADEGVSVQTPAAVVEGVAAAVTPETPRAAPAPRLPPVTRPPQDEAIDLLGTAGLPVLKRLAPVLGGLLVLALIWRVVRRR